MKTMNRVFVLLFVIALIMLPANPGTVFAQDPVKFEGLSWSPDSEQLAFSGNGKLYLASPVDLEVNPAGGKDAATGKLPQIVGSLVYYINDESGATEIVISESDGSIKELTNDKFPKQQMAVNPTVGIVAYTAFDPVANTPADLYLVDAEGIVRQLTNTPAVLEAYPVWSADGQWLAYSMSDFQKNQHKICIASVAKDYKAQCFNAVGSYPSGLKFSLDGKNLAFIAATKINTNLYGVYNAPVANGVMRAAVLLTKDNTRFEHLTTPGWDVTGRLVYIEADAKVADNKEATIYAIDLKKPKIPFLLTGYQNDAQVEEFTNVTYAATSPNGEWLAYVGVTPGGDKLCMVALGNASPISRCDIDAEALE